MTRNRSQVRRLYWIDAALQGGDRPHAADLAQALGVSRQTVHRDLRRLREAHRAPVSFDPTQGGYGYGHPFRPALPPLPLQEALELAESLRRLDRLTGSALEATLIALAEQVSAFLALDSPKPGLTPAPAARNRSRTVAPGSDAEWRGPVRGAGQGSESLTVVVRFDPPAAASILESGVFLRDEVQLLTGGGFEAAVRPHDPDGFLLSLVRWAPHFTVVAPAWARRRLPQLLRRVLRQWELRAKRARRR